MTFYLSGAGTYCVFLVYRMFQDSQCSKTDSTSWLVIAIASLFWILVIPLSLLELRAKAKDKNTYSLREIERLENNPTPLTDY